MLSSSLAVALAAPATAHCQRQLPPLPDSVETPIGYVRVLKVAMPCNDARALGCFASLRRIIFVKDSMAPIMGWKVYLHEVGHLRLFDAYIRVGDPLLEDRIVDLWANLQLGEMLARPPSVPPPAAPRSYRSAAVRRSTR